MQVNSAEDLKQFLLTTARASHATVVERMMTMPFGRGMEYQDMPQVRLVQADARADDYRFQSIISAVVRSEIFLHNEKIADAEVATAVR